MARIAGIDLPREKRIEIGLTYIYGIGRKSANDILAMAGVDPDIRVKDLTEDQESALRDVIDKNYTIEGDLRREVAAGQQSVASAPVMLVLASNQGKFGSLGDAQAAQRLGTLDAGYVSQNIYLACTAQKLGTVARATMNVEVLKKELGLGADRLLLLNHPIGWEESK